jgi:hypothetical protein
MAVAKRELGRTGLQVTTFGYGALELRGAPRARDITEAQAEAILNNVLESMCWHGRLESSFLHCASTSATSQPSETNGKGCHHPSRLGGRNLCRSHSTVRIGLAGEETGFELPVPVS